jgi:hypothetical protein
VRWRCLPLPIPSPLACFALVGFCLGGGGRGGRGPQNFDPPLGGAARLALRAGGNVLAPCLDSPAPADDACKPTESVLAAQGHCRPRGFGLVQLRRQEGAPASTWNALDGSSATALRCGRVDIRTNRSSRLQPHRFDPAAAFLEVRQRCTSKRPFREVHGRCCCSGFRPATGTGPWPNRSACCARRRDSGRPRAGEQANLDPRQRGCREKSRGCI